MASSSSSPCAACKFLRRKCTPGCVFAPYFPPDQMQKFIHVHRVFGASNVAKILNDISPAQREDAVNSLAYEAEARQRDPVYGCVGYISLLQHRIRQVQHELQSARSELYTYLGPTAFASFLDQNHLLLQQGGVSASAAVVQPQPQPGNLPLGLAQQVALLREQQQRQQQIEAAQMQINAWAEAAREQELLRRYQQNELLRLNSAGLVTNGSGHDGGEGVMTTNSMGCPVAVAIAPNSSGGLSFCIPQQLPPPHDQHDQHEEQQQIMQQSQQHREERDEVRSVLGPST